MKQSSNRPTSLSIDLIDIAIQEALLRVSQARELSVEECNSISGAGEVGGGDILNPFPKLPIGPTVGMIDPLQNEK